jgi:multiple sugar transport system substrate-binding protein
MRHLLLTTVAIAALALPASAQDLRMTIWSANEAHLALFNEIAADYAAANPGVTVAFEALPFNDYTTTLTTQIAGGNPPDLAWIFETSAADFIGSGALLPLSPILTATDGYAYDDVTESATALWRQDGVLYAYPFSTSPFGVFVNEDLVRAAGEKTPAEMVADGTWTWDNAFALAAAVKANGAQGLVPRDFNYQNWQLLAPIFKGWGASPWDASGDTCTLNAPEMVAAMTAIHGAIFDTGAIPGPGEAVDFFAGESAMTVTQISRASLLPKENPFAWDLVPLPAGEAGDYAVIGQAAIGVFAASPNAEAAAGFLAFMTNPENSVRLAQFFPPARQSLLNVETLGPTNPLLSPEQLEAVVVRGIETGTVIPGHEGFAQIQQTVRAELDALWQPDADVQAVLDSACAAIEPLL